MDEPYSDEQLAAIEADVNHVYDTLKLWPTIRRLLAERDDARRVAREAAALVRKHVIWQLMSHVERCKVERAEAYPEVPHG